MDEDMAKEYLHIRLMETRTLVGGSLGKKKALEPILLLKVE